MEMMQHLMPVNQQGKEVHRIETDHNAAHVPKTSHQQECASPHSQTPNPAPESIKTPKLELLPQTDQKVCEASASAPYTADGMRDEFGQADHAH